MSGLANFLMTLIFVPLLFGLSICLAWIPMIAWNHSLVEMFPQLPHITYWQAFWLTILCGYVFHRPTVDIKKD